MCVFCTARRITMMLPWLVIPLIGMWALSQLLPMRFRVEITSTRLACVGVLLATLFWYEVLMPKLSAWTDRRSVWLREKRRLETMEVQKFKKSAVRRCRNCFTVYKDQNPCGGRFMCAYCGHFSKRPVLDLPLTRGMIQESRSDNACICKGQDNTENANWIGGVSPVKTLCWGNGEGVVCGLKDGCTNETSYTYGVNFACNLLRSLLSSVWWVCRKIFRVGLTDDDMLLDEQHGWSRTRRSQKTQNGSDFQESRSDKARRKAEEKRQARLEKEKLEEEERKQREEVARLVEERRKLRDEIEKVSVKRFDAVKERQRKDAEKKRQGRKRESDKGSCNSNSDAENLERNVKDNVRKLEHERKDDTHRCAEMNSRKGSPVQTKDVTPSYSKGNDGTRYLDRVRGTFLSSSKAFSGGSFFSRGASNQPLFLKENRSGASTVSSQSHANQKSTIHPDHSIRKPVLSSPPSTAAPKKSWGQLFSRASPVVPYAILNVIDTPQIKDPLNLQNSLPPQSFGSPLDFGLPSPCTPSAFPKVSTNVCSGFQSPTEIIFPLTEKSPQKLLPEEPEIFADPCYIPAPCEVIRPSPIEPPLSRQKVHDNRNSLSKWPTKSQKATNMNDLHTDDSISGNQNGTWQMWNSPPLVEDGMLGGCGSLNWNLSDDLTKEDTLHQPHRRCMGLLFSNNSHATSGSNSPVKVISHSSQTGDDGISPFLSSVDQLTLLEKTVSPQLSDSDDHSDVSAKDEVNHNGVTFGSRSDSAKSSLLDHSLVDSRSKNRWDAYESGENLSDSYIMPPAGGLYSNPAAQSLWSVY